MNYREKEGDDKRRQHVIYVYATIGGCVEHLKHTAVTRIGRLRVPYRVGRMHAAAYDIHQRRPATTIAGVLLFLSCSLLPSGDSPAVAARRHFASFVRSALHRLFSPRLLLPDLLLPLFFVPGSFNSFSSFFFSVCPLSFYFLFRFISFFKISSYFCLLFFYFPVEICLLFELLNDFFILMYFLSILYIIIF